jgi:tetratricopeptide (TPR) repeat protein
MAEVISELAAPFLVAVGQLDLHLQKLLPERDSLQKVLNHLESTTTETLLHEEAFERRRLWQDSGLFYANSGRLLEAIELFSRLNEKIGESRVRRQDWLPCGMPLVWISDYYRKLS